MRIVLFAIAALAVGLAVSPEAAAADAPAQEAAAPSAGWANDVCAPRIGDRGHRRSVAEPRACRTPRSLLRGCAFVVDVRATALRFASNRRRHAHTVRCIVDDRAGANGAGA